MEYNTPYEAKPIIKVLVNIDGIDKEIALWFDMIWENGEKTNQFKTTKTGSKILSGKVKDPHQPNTQAPPTTQSPEFDDDIPF